MSVTVGLLDFYILEASEYVDQLDALVGAAVHAPPESTPFITAARALRGSSTMAKLLRMAELAGSVERVGRGLARRVAFGGRRRASCARSSPRSMTFASCSGPFERWGAAEEQRAAARIAELRAFVPDGAAAPNTPISGAVSPTFFASEVEGVASALDAYVAAPADRRSLDEALGRVRALRGISALKDLPPLADVADAIETAARTSTGEGRSADDAAHRAVRRIGAGAAPSRA